MALDLEKFAQTRSHLYHLTARSNLSQILAAGCLRPAADLLTSAGEAGLLRTRRRQSQIVTVNGRSVHIRDQAPLHAGNLALPNGCLFEDFLMHLNEHVFFWPGTQHGPIGYGRRHFERYANEDNVVLVLDTAAVFAANPAIGPRFCRFNSGSPRCSGGKPSPRSLGTFATAREYPGTPSSVVEVVYRAPVALPGGRVQTMAPNDFL